MDNETDKWGYGKGEEWGGGNSGFLEVSGPRLANQRREIGRDSPRLDKGVCLSLFLNLELWVLVTLAVCLPVSPAHGKRNAPDGKCNAPKGEVTSGGDKRDWMTDWPPDPLKKLQNKIQKLEKTMQTPGKCAAIFKEPDFSCKNYAECRGDAISRAALLLGPLKSVEKDVKQEQRRAAKHVKKVYQKLNRLLKDSSKQCREKCTKGKKRCKFNSETSPNWEDCKARLTELGFSPANITMVLTAKLKHVLSSQEPVSDTGKSLIDMQTDTVDEKWVWGTDWNRWLVHALQQQLSTLIKEVRKDFPAWKDNRTPRNKHCKKLFQEPDYCCKNYTVCKRNVGQRLRLFVKPFKILKKYTDKRPKNNDVKDMTHIGKSIPKVTRALMGLVKNVSGQCRDSLNSSDVKSAHAKSCETTADKKCSRFLRKELNKFVKRAKPGTADRRASMVLLLADELDTFLQRTNLTMALRSHLAEEERKGKCEDSGPAPRRRQRNGRGNRRRRNRN
ncbi:hypothetical protein BaRGS_00007957 [Batillaria attramentaria]|uniref:Uncharacterized protein n=1 Tax=Batillaria attramentaria TaxID=370345 RepID=A0ABD0LNC9_9CAEN